MAHGFVYAFCIHLPIVLVFGGNKYQMGIISTRQISIASASPSQSSIKLFTQNGCMRVEIILLAHRYSSVKLGYSKWGSWGNGLSVVSEMRRLQTSLQRLVTLTPILSMLLYFSQVLPITAFSSFILVISFNYCDDTITREVLPWQPTLCRRHLEP